MRFSAHAGTFIACCAIALFATAVFQRVANPSLEFRLDTPQQGAPQNTAAEHDHPPLAPEDAAALGSLMGEMRASPQNAELALRIAEIFIRNKDWINAAAFLEKTVELAPDNQKAWHLAGFTRSRQGEYARAAEAYEKAAAVSPEPQTLFSLGVIYRYHLNTPQKALTLFTAVKNSPQSDLSLRQQAEREISSLMAGEAGR